MTATIAAWQYWVAFAAWVTAALNWWLAERKAKRYKALAERFRDIAERAVYPRGKP